MDEVYGISARRSYSAKPSAGIGAAFWDEELSMLAATLFAVSSIHSGKLDSSQVPCGRLRLVSWQCGRRCRTDRFRCSMGRQCTHKILLNTLHTRSMTRKPARSNHTLESRGIMFWTRSAIGVSQPIYTPARFASGCIQPAEVQSECSKRLWDSMLESSLL